MSSEDGNTFLINKLKSGNYHSIGSEPHKALLKTIGIDPNTTNKQVIFYCGEDRGSDDPVKQAIDLCNNYGLVLPEPNEKELGHYQLPRIQLPGRLRKVEG